MGGGIGGLAAAVALKRRGIDATVFEQARALTEIGAGVQLQPNGTRLLHSFGLGEALSAVGAPLGDGSAYFRQDGAPIAPIRTTDSQDRPGMMGVHRADLVGILADALPDDTIRTGHKSIGFDQTATEAVLTFENGDELSFDAVIAADGIHSALQQYVVEPSEPVYSGSVAFRGYVPRELVPEWPERVSLLWMGADRHMLVYPLRGGKLINYVGFVPRAQAAIESWSAPGDPDQLRAEFAGWDPLIQHLLEQVDETFWWGLRDRAPLPRWTEGRLTLLGDAAHPMLPHLGQGANQSIEDAATLGVLLDGATPEDLPDRLQTYEKIRLPRAARVQQGARANGLRYDSAYVDLEQRDREIQDSVQFRLSIFDYDALAVAEEAVGIHSLR
ncbi:FAD-dependent monooxygenase [Microbacterium sp.]|uniref:FAD-dependent monooxygenase n=1 Tax=Microbacterium sp. TaxID=51671 RepID=UPI00272D2C77|nr:FAD-dependent monooxygenase [Microbacterium sp.]